MIRNEFPAENEAIVDGEVTRGFTHPQGVLGVVVYSDAQVTVKLDPDFGFQPDPNVPVGSGQAVDSAVPVDGTEQPDAQVQGQPLFDDFMGQLGEYPPITEPLIHHVHGTHVCGDGIWEEKTGHQADQNAVHAASVTQGER